MKGRLLSTGIGMGWVILGILFTRSAIAIPVNLNDFFADPTVSISSDGMSAVFTEDPTISSVLLSNDPGLGDLEVIVASAGAILSFDYDFIEGPDGVSDDGGNDDKFSAFLLNGFTGDMIFGFDFSAIEESSGTVSFDLTSLVGMTLGMQFELLSLGGDLAFDSMLTISNLDLSTNVTTVDEPSVLIPLLMGLLALHLRKRVRR